MKIVNTPGKISKNHQKKSCSAKELIFDEAYAFDMSHVKFKNAVYCFRICLLLIPCIILQTNSQAQKPIFDHLDIEDGLSQNSVLAIAQDSRGFMWLGTRRGLNRYDGNRFKIYLHDNNKPGSLSGDYINTILSDSHQTLWIGTSFAGLEKYLPEKDAFEHMPLISQNKNGLTSPLINCLYEDRHGNLWVGTSSGLNFLIDREKKIFRLIDLGPSAKNVRAVYEDDEGIIWVGTNSGLLCLKKKAGNFMYENLPHENKTAGLDEDAVTTIFEDTLHNLWIGTVNEGIFRYDRITQSFSRVLNNSTSPAINNNIRKITGDKNGRLWIATQEGLNIYDPQTKTCISSQHDPADKKSLSQNSIYSLFTDAAGSVWTGTYFGGANIVYAHPNSFSVWQNSDKPNSISNNAVSAACEDEKHNLWIGTEGGGLNYLNRANNSVVIYKNKPGDERSIGSNLVKCLYKDNDGNLWIGTHGGGINLLPDGGKSFMRFLYNPADGTTPALEITSVLEDRNKHFWIGTNYGLRLFHRDKTELKPYDAMINKMPRSGIRVLQEDSRGNVWAGTSSGTYLLEQNSNEFRRVENFGQREVNCIREDTYGNIWVALYYGGIAMLEKSTGKFLFYKTTDGLPNDNVASMEDDGNGSLWIATGNGLCRFFLKTRTFQTYTTSDGLAGNEFNNNASLKSATGEMFFGGFNGFTGFIPRNIQTNNYKSPVVFTGLKLFNKDVEVNGNDGLLSKEMSFSNILTFHHSQDVFNIEFALLNYIRSNKNKYTYKLDGFDKVWNETNTPSVNYTNLPSGSYTFLVKGANNDGIWGPVSSLKIKVLPPFWRSWWAWSIYTLLFAAIVFLVARFFFLRALLKKENELHQFKLNFFTNISHDIRTHLALILGPVEKLTLTTKQDGIAGNQLQTIKRNAERLLRLLSELMDFRKAETGHLNLHISNGNIIAFLQDICSSFESLSISRNIKTSLVSDTGKTIVWFDKKQLEKVFVNLLSNAYKFTPDGGYVSITIVEKQSVIEIKVTDNGKGIAPANINRLFDNYYQEEDNGEKHTGYGVGLALSKSIIELHKGNITVESHIEKDNVTQNRTSFTVMLLKGNDHFNKEWIVTSNANAASEQKDEILLSDIPGNDLQMQLPAKTNTILLVEDNPEVRSFICESLSNQYIIIESENGEKGWQTATGQIPDLIISDVMMPVMDGFTLCNKLKTDERTSHIPVILLTAKSTTDNQISGLEMGADIYLTKPFSTRVLELHIRNLLASREKLRIKFNEQINAAPEEGSKGFSPLAENSLNEIDREFLQKVITLVDEYMDDPEFDIPMLCTKVAMSKPVLYKKLKAVTNMSVNDFIKSLRLKKAAELLQQKQLNVSEVAFAVGFLDRKYFSKEFKKQFGKLPSEFAGSNTQVAENN